MSAVADEAEIAELIASLVAGALDVAEDEIDRDLPLAAQGLGSRDLVSLTGELEDWLGFPMAPTLVWEFPTIALLARHLAGIFASRATHADA